MKALILVLALSIPAFGQHGAPCSPNDAILYTGTGFAGYLKCIDGTWEKMEAAHTPPAYFAPDQGKKQAPAKQTQKQTEQKPNQMLPGEFYLDEKEKPHSCKNVSCTGNDAIDCDVCWKVGGVNAASDLESRVTALEKQYAQSVKDRDALTQLRNIDLSRIAALKNKVAVLENGLKGAIVSGNCDAEYCPVMVPNPSPEKVKKLPSGVVYCRCSGPCPDPPTAKCPEVKQ